MKFYHRVTNKVFYTKDLNINTTNINEIKGFICKNMNGITPDNIKFIKNGLEIKEFQHIVHDMIEFLIIPITCTNHV